MDCKESTTIPSRIQVLRLDTWGLQGLKIEQHSKSRKESIHLGTWGLHNGFSYLLVGLQVINHLLEVIALMANSLLEFGHRGVKVGSSRLNGGLHGLACYILRWRAGYHFGCSSQS
jgi:hypothetical protein